jgi:3'-phosphoadenosine 5'-phosphosulfate sulfotransferase (PAPS reductase)/FAD synthetase
MLNNKIDKALELIENSLKEYKKPVIMTSFGKDSMVMIDLIRKINKDIPCISHKEPFFPKKYAFSNKVAEELNLTVYDYAPYGTAVQEKNGEVEIMNYYNFKNSGYALPTGIIQPKENEPFLCGLFDIYLKPTGHFNFAWDACFIGHKSSDSDIFYESLELKVDIQKHENDPDLIFPLRYFTHNDIWEYTDKYNVMWNDKRYDRGQDETKEKFRNQFKDTTYNCDYFECCTKCLNKNEKEEVYCPKFKETVPNVSNKINYLDSSIPIPYTV